MQHSALAIIAGSGMDSLPGLEVDEQYQEDTPWGKSSAPVSIGRYQGNVPLLFLPRHGCPHSIAPHLINYRANIHALHKLGVRRVIAVNAVGGIGLGMTVGKIVIPDQIIDYTHGREASFCQLSESSIPHLDFSFPYTENLRERLLRAGQELRVAGRSVHGVSQGPRLETVAEVRRMQNDGCDIVGMTGMPEAILAREKGIEYACIALIVNLAAGKSSAEISIQEIKENLASGMARVQALLAHFLAQDPA
ncbi:MAG: S-methyl-5'-thioinosine phosphorylase [Candidatus Eutrophobiaceae bacterium]